MEKAKNPKVLPKASVKKFKAKKRAKSKGGRPPSYRDEFVEQAFNYCLLGATDKELAAFFGVCENTLLGWKKRYPQFLRSTKDAKEKADGVVVKALYQRAKGYVGKKTVTATDKGVVTDVRVVDDYVGPDTTACIFWLKNRQKEQWRDRHDVGLSGHLALGAMSEDEIRQELAALIGGAVDGIN